MSRALVAIVVVLGVAILVAFSGRPPAITAAMAPAAAKPPSSIPGYGELGACSSSQAVEGDNLLQLHPDGRAELIDGDAKATAGYWTFDPASERYTVSFNGRPGLY